MTKIILAKSREAFVLRCVFMSRSVEKTIYIRFIFYVYLLGYMKSKQKRKPWVLRWHGDEGGGCVGGGGGGCGMAMATG